MPLMRRYEWIVLVYFVYLAGASLVRRIALGPRLLLLASAAIVGVILLGISSNGPDGGWLRGWLPVVYILGGYYASAALFVQPSETPERWLLEWDRYLLGDPAKRFLRWPRVFLAYLEIVYIFCFLLVPAGYAALLAAGRGDLTERYWTMVVAAELGSFVSLVVVQARPPWAVERRAVLADRAVHRAAAAFVERLTTRVNTFPSGHVAGSLAVALAVMPALPLAGMLFLVLAVSIAMACVVGRYHYIADVVAGAVLAVAIALVT